MRILKYIFLLLLLSLVALSVFVATQKGDFLVERSKIINSPKPSVFRYVNDIKNWKDWNSLAAGDSLININYSQTTIGKNSSFTWNGEQGDGDLQTLNSVGNDSIVQVMNFNGNSATVSMSFKDTLGKTKVTWKAKGKMSFLYKALTTFNGGANKIYGAMFENSLNHLDRRLDYEINTYTVKVNGVTNFPETFYLAQSFTSEFSKVSKNSEIVFSKITRFCNNNNITISGKPFVIYHTYDTIREITKLSICIPINRAIFLVDGSDLTSKTIRPFQALKTTLTGDYVHNKKALNKSKQYLKSKYLNTDPAFSHIEIYTLGKKDSNSPSKWITDIYIPIRQKITPKPTVEVTTETNEAPQPTIEEKEKPSEF
jgi:effector-binding domain-containing protein